MKTVLNVLCVDDLQNIRKELLEDGDVMRKLRDKLKEEDLSLFEQNEIRKQIIDLLCKDLMSMSQLQ